MNRDILIDRAYTYLLAKKQVTSSSGDADAANVAAAVCNLVAPYTIQPITEELVLQRLDTIATYQEQLQGLLKLPVVEQRSSEWYELRKSMITASDLAQALGEGKFGTQKDFLIKKCGYKDIPFDGNIPPLRWGVKYEPVANALYELKYHTRVHEFGILKHPDNDFIGASPDGISELGIMLEIKCPFRRKIDGTIPTQYYYQIQAQLDVCQLTECDYFECELKEYGSQDAFVDSTDATGRYDMELYDRGVLLEYSLEGDPASYQYLYGPINSTIDEVKSWIQTTTDSLYKQHQSNVATLKETYWKCIKMNVQRVYRDDSFIDAAYTKARDVWHKVLLYRSDRSLYDQEIDPPPKEVMIATPYADATPSVVKEKEPAAKRSKATTSRAKSTTMTAAQKDNIVIETNVYTPIKGYSFRDDTGAEEEVW
jgi:putative phage-type endonuclease